MTDKLFKIEISYDSDFVDLLAVIRKKYGDEIFNQDGIGEQMDLNLFSKKIYNSKSMSDASVDSNSNVSEFIPSTYVNELPKPYFRLNSYYLLWKKLRQLYTSEIAGDIIERQISGDIYINDCHGIASGQAYCYNFSCLDIINKGLPMIKKINTLPPKHLYSFKSQVEQFVSYTSNSILGASGMADLLVCMAWYAEKIIDTQSDAKFHFKTKKDCVIYIEENLASLIYTLNQPFRSGLQSPFSNISIYDKVFLESMINDYIFPDGKKADLETIQLLQEMFLKIVNKELKRTPITFPVVTACFAVDNENNIIDKEFLSMISRENQEFGFINIYCGKTSTLSSCCRLRSDKENPYFNSFGVGRNKIGSIGVCTINMPRLAFKYKDKTVFMEELKKLVEVTARMNHAKRHIINKRIEDGHLPLYSLGFMDTKQQYSTCGLNGIYECLEILGFDLVKPDGQDALVEILSTINKEVEKFQEKFGAPHNIEQIPAESVSVKFAEKDRLMKYNDRYEIYSNQFIPLSINGDLLDRIYLQGRFDSMFSGGAICHLNIEQRITDVRKIEDLIKFSAKKGVIYFAINYNLQRCKNSHMSVGKNEKCNICGKEITDNFTRVVGFLTNTKNFNPVRREVEYPKRHWYKDLTVKCE